MGAEAPAAPYFSYADLLQELLLALSGFPGDVFVERENLARFKEVEGVVPHPDHCTLALSYDVDWVEEPDRAVLQQLLTLGFHYAGIKAFVDRESAPSAAPTSLYRRALSAGLQELLSVYTASLLALQHSLAEQPHTALSAIHYSLADFSVLLPEVHKLVYEVAGGSGSSAASGVAGSAGSSAAKLLATLHKASSCGVPLLESCATRLLWHCQQVLFKQLSAWMLHGLLLDPCTEFFIALPAPAAAAATAPLALPAAGAARAGGGVAGSLANPGLGQGLGSGTHDAASHEEWYRGFEIVRAAKPYCISDETADKVLFIGKAVRVLSAPGEGQHRNGQLQQLPALDMAEAAQQLRSLQQQRTFDRIGFERAVEGVRARVAALLWRLLVVQAGLVSHIAAIKDYFLLARGDFFDAFLLEASKLMQQGPRPATVDADIDVPWQQAAAKTSTSADTLFHLFRLRWRPPPAAAGAASAAAASDPQPQLQLRVEVPRADSAWDPLCLEYAAQWPLGLVLSPLVLAKYNALFQLLLRLKRVQLRLDAAFLTLLKVDGSRRGRQGQQAQLVELRRQMAHLVTNLQVYLQTDVIEGNYKELEARISAAQDFREAERAHAQYLNQLMTQSFLNHAVISRNIGDVFGHIWDLCAVIEQGRHREGGLDYGRMVEIGYAFRAASGLLYSSLRSVRLTSTAPQLQQFYMRLNYNDWIGQKATAVGASR